MAAIHQRLFQRLFSYSHASRQGFTLLEMSIVIAIIGLLVGGLMAGQAYMKGAQLTTMINESKFYIDAFNRFQNLYASVPGDMPNASVTWTGTHNGDGNGIIRATSSGTSNNAELFQSFEHLANAGLIPGSFTGVSTGGAGTAFARANVNVPESSVNTVVFMFDHPDAMDGNVPAGDPAYFDSSAASSSGLYGHVLRVAGLLPTGNSLPTRAFLTPKQALQLDTKFDDGLPNKGWIMTPKNAIAATGANCVTAGVGGGSFNYSTLTVLDSACYFILRIQ